MAALKIGQVATLAGVAVDTVRYYESRGLVAAAGRRSSGYRIFDETTVERIKLIKQLQELGLTLEEIERMFAAVIEHGSDCKDETERIEVALRRTEAKLAALEDVRRNLERALQACHGGACDFVARVKQTSPSKRR